jgi:hypothetical protein
MTVTSLLPVIAASLFLLFALYVAGKKDARMKKTWLLPAALSLLFMLFSLQAVTSEGMFGFWPEHTRNLWGNQIWLDLLLAVGIGWFFVVPQAKALGMRPLPWLALIACTGCIGYLGMIARLLYLREHSGQLGYDSIGAPNTSPSDAPSRRG